MSAQQARWNAALPVGDVNADGRPDFAVRARHLLVVYSGSTGESLHGLRIPPEFLEFDFCAAGDVDGDGHADLAISLGAEGIRIHSGKSGTVLRTIEPLPGAELGTRIEAAGDFDLDGIPELLLGTPSASLSGLEAQGAGWVISGADGTVLLSITGSEASAGWGEFLGGRPGPGESYQLVVGGRERAGSYSLVQGELKEVCYWELPSEPDGRDRIVSARGDVNGDGWPDPVVCWRSDQAKPYRNGDVQVLSGRDGSLLHRWKGESLVKYSSSGEVIRVGRSSGTSAAHAGDLNGDGYGDVIVGWPDWAHGGDGCGSGKFEIRSGMDGSTLLQVKGRTFSDCFYNIYDLGLSVAPLGDVDGDGRAEVLAGFDILRGGMLVISSVDGKRLLEVRP